MNSLYFCSCFIGDSTVELMITHEPDIASFAKRNFLFRDGKIVDDHVNLTPTTAGAGKQNS